MCHALQRFSRANPQKKKRDAAFIGESADTLRGMLAFLRSHRPPLFIFENVDAMGDSSPTAYGQGQPESIQELGSDMDVAMSHWASLGYECQRVMVSSENFGTPTSRSRILVIGFQTTANAAFDFTERSLSCVFNTMRTLLQVCNRTHSCASGVLLPSTDAAVCMDGVGEEAGRPRGLWPEAGGFGSRIQCRQRHGACSRAWCAVGSFGPSPAMMGDAWFQTLTKQQQDAVCFFFEDAPGFSVVSGREPNLGPDTHIDPLCGGLQTLCVRHVANPDAHGFCTRPTLSLAFGQGSFGAAGFPEPGPDAL